MNIDRTRFKGARAVLGQMDATQDKADRQVLVLSDDYLRSPMCQHEMNRAVALDRDFTRGVVMPIKRDDCTLPASISNPNPLYADLRDDRQAAPWRLVLDVCGADLGTTAPDWLKARDGIVRYLGRRQSVSLEIGEKDRPGAVASDLTGLAALLDACNARLEREDRRLLLALDEYETLDRKFGEGVFDEDLLAMIRESIQSHRRLIWAFAGSHHIVELTHAPWASYLVSVRTVEVPAFTEAETRLLLTEPLKHSPLWADDEARRPRFDPAFWGEDGIERIHAEAGGWPHLVQLLAETTVDLLNDSEQPAVSPGLLDQAFDQAVVNGQVVLQQLMKDESELPGEWDYLRGFRRADTQPPPEDEAIFESLRRRQLFVEDGGQWRLRAPLMQRWLCK